MTTTTLSEEGQIVGRHSRQSHPMVALRLGLGWNHTATIYTAIMVTVCTLIEFVELVAR